MKPLYVDMNKKPHFLTKSGYYIVPNPSTALPGQLLHMVQRHDPRFFWSLIGGMGVLVGVRGMVRVGGITLPRSQDGAFQLLIG
jgi:hypothetical protein